MIYFFQLLRAWLTDDDKYGFIVMDGKGALFATLAGNAKEILHKFSVDLPPKHGQYPLIKLALNCGGIIGM